MYQFAIAWQIQVEQARQPEAQRGLPQHQRPGMVFAVFKRAHRMIRAQKCLCPTRIKSAVGVHAPVIDGDRHVIQQGIGAGEIKIYQPAYAVLDQQYIVAEQVGVNQALR